MADATVGVTDLAAGTGVKKVDTTELTVAGGLVERQRIIIADNTGAALFATVTAGGALKVDNSAVTQPVSGSVSITGNVTGTFFQTTQPVSGTVTVSGSPMQATGGTVGLVAGIAAIGSVSVTGTTAVSAASLPLPSGAMGSSGGTVGLVAGVAAIGTVGVTSLPSLVLSAGAAAIGTVGVTGSVAITAASLPLPTNAMTATGGTVGLVAGVAAIGSVTITGTPTISGTVTANAGTNLNTSALALDATLTGGTQQTKITDGTRLATVKAASTAAVATDTALVVALSPNNPITTTTTALAATSSPSYANATNNSLSANLAGALRVDGSGVTQPVSGTVAATQSGTWTVQPGNTANTTAWKVDGSAVTQPVSLAANQSVNNALINGIAPLMGNGVTGTGSQRVTISSDNAAFSVNAVQSGTWNVGTITTLPALPANQSVNIAQMAGVATSMGAGVADTGTQRVVLSNEAAADLNITGQAVQSAAGQNIILAVAGVGATDCTGYRAVSVQIIPAGTVSSGVVSFEGSNDNVTFTAISLQDETAPTADPVSTVSPLTGVNRYMTGPVRWRYFRARISTVIGGGGSIAAVTRLTQVSFSDDQISVTQTTASLLNMTVGAALPTGSATIGGVTLAAVTGAGLTVAPQLIAAATTNATSVKASVGKIHGGSICNTTASTKYYWKIYDKASAPTVGTDTPVATILLPTAATLYIADLVSVYGLRCVNGIAYAITALPAVADTTAVTAIGDVIVNLLYL